MPTKVTCLDLDSGDEDSAVIQDDYILVTDGRCKLDGAQVYGNGTVVLTIKKRPIQLDSSVPDGGTR